MRNLVDQKKKEWQDRRKGRKGGGVIPPLVGARRTVGEGGRY